MIKLNNYINVCVYIYIYIYNKVIDIYFYKFYYGKAEHDFLFKGLFPELHIVI